MPDETTLLENNFKIKCADGFPLAATSFRDEKLTVRYAVVLASALGVPRFIYFKLALYLAGSGVAVLTFDYRGIYESQHHSYSGSNIRMKDWGRYDVNATLRWTQDNWQPEKLYYLGHSCGGQILGLAPHSTEIDRAVFIAS